jgi:hypothetical protein
MRSTYPARQQFELHRTTGSHDLWVNGYTIRYSVRAQEPGERWSD